MTLAALSLTIAALVALLWQRRTAATLAGARVPSDVVSSAFQRTGKRVDPVTGAALASWPRRAAGGLVDALVVLFLCSIVIVVVGAAEAFANPETDDISDTSVLILLLAILLIPPLYQWLLIGKWGRTLGKKAVGVKVLRGNDAGRVSYPRALQRALAFEVLGIVPFLLVVAFLWPLWDDRCQTLYDKVAGTIVVRLRGSE